MAQNKNEAVTVSFHYLCRSVKQANGDRPTTPFTKAQFEALFVKMKAQPAVNLENEAATDRLRCRLEVPLENLVRMDDRTIFGTFKSSYWGHEYENTAKGQIPADSISLRPFCFLLYLSESGKIYVASQYLGQFGGYSGLQRTLSDMLGGMSDVVSHSFRLGSHAYKNAQAKEVQASFSSRTSSIAKDNKFGKSAVIIFKKASKDDDFEGTVSNRLFSMMDRSRAEMKKAVADLMREGDLIDVPDEDIEDCTVVANVNGRRKKIYLIEGGTFATRFPINVPVRGDGHPEREPTKAAMLELLRDEIVSRKEDV